MRKLGIAIALASTAMASPSLAKDKAWYVGADIGALIAEDAESTFANGVTANTPHKVGYDAAGMVGYDFGGFRLEAEYSHKKAMNKNSTYSNVSTPLPGGQARVDSLMLNGLIDFGPDDGLQGFIGGGAGIARSKISLPDTRDSDSGFAWQALAGVRYPVTDSVDLSLKYRYFSHDNIKLRSVPGVPLETEFKSHSILAGLAFNFGGAEPPPPPPPPPRRRLPRPPPPPPPPPVAQCAPGPYIVFFEWDSADITPDAASILDNAVSAYANCGTAQVMLAGHADKSGSPRYNVGLSERRNTSVRSYLTSKGIADGVISSEAFGESRPRVETADGVRELQNRRVEITYGPGSGS